jgi:hypothetical protein
MLTKWDAYFFGGLCPAFDMDYGLSNVFAAIVVSTD